MSFSFGRNLPKGDLRQMNASARSGGHYARSRLVTSSVRASLRERTYHQREDTVA